MADADVFNYMNTGFNSNINPPILPTLVAILTVNGMVLVYKVQQWLGIITTPPRIPGDELGKHLSDSVSSQQELGWEHFMKGCIASDWGKAHAVNFQIFQPNSTQYTQSCWETSLVKLLWNFFYHVWMARNNILYTSSHNLLELLTLNKQIKQAYYKLQHQMDSFDTALFHKPLAERLLTTLQSKAHWLAAVDIVVHDFTEVHGCVPAQSTMTSFFPRVSD
eukprot:12687851-Ditylum_brightwellii.AAC.1